MPVIAFANSKGGVGKSTAALVVGTTLAARGGRVSIIDADPNQPLKAWSRGASRSLVRIIGDVNESRIVPLIDAERAERQFVLVDLEGTASRMTSRAIARADLVLIPMQASAVDSAQAARAVALVREEEQVLARHIPARVLMTRTSPQIPTRNEKLIMEELRAAGVPVLAAHLNQRTAYQAIFTYRLALDELDPALVNGLAAARENADRLAGEVVETIRTLRGKAAA